LPTIKLVAALFLLITILVGSIFGAYSFNNDFGKISQTRIDIDSEIGTLTCLLYRPSDVKNQTYPAVVVAHGISESAQIMSAFGLELSRSGFVVLCLDLPGHGGSDGSINQDQNDLTLGIVAAVSYLNSLPYVDGTQIGLIGHSLGAGAVRAANLKLTNIQASILIGGGVGQAVSGTEYGAFNRSYPKNVLIIIGQYDCLFDITNLTDKELLVLFNTTKPIKPGVLYGDFQTQTARELITPKTTHLFESFDITAINQSKIWMEQSLKNGQSEQLGLIYPFREIAQTTALLALVGVTLLAYYPVAAFLKKDEEVNLSTSRSQRSKRKSYLVWFILNLSLFFPLIIAGIAVPFPPLVFGSSIAWWLLVTAIISLLIFNKMGLSQKIDKKSLIQAIKKELHIKKDLLLGVALFLILFIAINLMQTLGINVKLLAPIFQQFASIRRVLVFFAFLPFFLPYFAMQHLYLIKGISKAKIEYAKIILVNASPFLLLLALNILPKILFDFWLLPSFAGFIVEFLWLMTPIFAITTFCSIYLYRRTGSLTAGAVFNTLMLAWIAAVVFPFY
jgi:dienelactone hydrolase